MTERNSTSRAFLRSRSVSSSDCYHNITIQQPSVCTAEHYDFYHTVLLHAPVSSTPRAPHAPSYLRGFMQRWRIYTVRFPSISRSFLLVHVRRFILFRRIGVLFSLIFKSMVANCDNTKIGLIFHLNILL